MDRPESDGVMLRISPTSRPIVLSASIYFTDSLGSLVHLWLRNTSSARTFPENIGPAIRADPMPPGNEYRVVHLGVRGSLFRLPHQALVLIHLPTEWASRLHIEDYRYIFALAIRDAHV